jgi:pyruvate ferredoxin oxidoreductase alpha subunit
VLDPDVPHAFSSLPEANEYFAFQRNVADAMDEARSAIEIVASEFGLHFRRTKVGALEIAGNPDADTALVAIGTIGDSARELLDGVDDLLIVRVHAFRPFPAAALEAALAGASHVCVIDRAPAFGSLGPLGGDVRSLELPHAEAVANFVCGVGGTEVTPATLRWALHATRSGKAEKLSHEVLYVPEVV